MEYTKPEVAVLGTAKRVIQQPSKPIQTVLDNPPVDNSTPGPAYELDE
jgi:hypothetical protein